MVGFVLENVGAGGLAYASSYAAWWLPLVVFPVVMTRAVHRRAPPLPPSRLRLWFDFVLVLHGVAWLVVSATLCVRGLDSWWGLPAGLAAGAAGVAAMAPPRWAAEL